MKLTDRPLPYREYVRTDPDYDDPPVVVVVLTTAVAAFVMFCGFLAFCVLVIVVLG